MAIWAGIATLLILTVYPLAVVAVQAFLPHLFDIHPTLALTIQPVREVFTDPYILRMLLDSGILSLGTAILATGIGLGLAILIRRTDVPGRSIWTTLVWVTLLTPSFLQGMGWDILMQPGGLMASIVTMPPFVRTFFYSPWGLALILALKNFPFAFLAISPALPWLGGELEAGARVLGAKRAAVWWRIYLPLLIPFLASGASLIFAEVLADFGMASTVAQSAGFPLITYQIYSDIYNIPTDYPGSGALAILLTAAVGGALILQSILLGRLRYGTIHGSFRPAPPIKLGRLRLVVIAFLLLFFVVALALPLLTSVMVSFMHNLGTSLTWASLTLVNYATVIRSGSPELAALTFSVYLAVLVATVTILLGTFLAYAGRQGTGSLRAVLEGLSIWVIGVPGIVLAAGYIFAWNQRWLIPLHLLLYGTVWALFLAYLAGGMPYVLRFQMGALTQLDSSLLAAARVQGAGLLDLFRRVLLPLLAEGSLSLWMFVLASTAFELPASTLLYPPGQPTLARVIMDLYHNTTYGPGTAITVLSALAVLVPLLVLRVAVRRWLPVTKVEER